MHDDKFQIKVPESHFVFEARTPRTGYYRGRIILMATGVANRMFLNRDGALDTLYQNEVNQRIPRLASWKSAEEFKRWLVFCRAQGVALTVTVAPDTTKIHGLKL